MQAFIPGYKENPGRGLARDTENKIEQNAKYQPDRICQAVWIWSKTRRKKEKEERKSCNFSTEQERIRGWEHTQTETFKQNDKMKEKLKEYTKNLQTKQNNIKKKKL